MRKIGLFIAVCSVFIFGKTYSQQSIIKIASEINMLCTCDQVTVGDTMKYQYAITNIGDGAMQTPYVYWNGGGYTVFASFDNKIKVTNEAFPSNPKYYSWLNDDESTVAMRITDPQTFEPVDYIMPGDTAIVEIKDVVMLSRHSEGSNTIVVWPENTYGTTIKDSLKYNIEVVNDNGQPDLNSSFEPWLINSKIYPNPASDIIYIQGLDGEEDEIKRLFIQDLNGRKIKEFSMTNNQFYIGDIAAGHYVLSFELSDKSTFTKPLLINK